MEEAIRQKKAAGGEEQVNPLRNERVSVRFVPQKGGPWGDDPRHALYGGMAENATVGLVVPVVASTGAFKNVLTNSEKPFLENALGLEPNALSVYKKDNNYWAGYTVLLGKHGTTLDLSDPEDYIKWKVLLANGDIVAKSLQELQDRPKTSYRFVLVNENDETGMENSKMSATMESYREFGRIENDADTMRVLVELLDARPYAESTKPDFLKARINSLIQADAKTFLATIRDPMLHTKVVIRRAVETGKLGRRNDLYYLSDGTPLCGNGENSTLSVAARWLNEPAHQDVKAMLEAAVDSARGKRR